MLQKAKYLLIGLLIGIFITGCAAAAFGGPVIKVFIDDKELHNAQALNIDGKVYVPLRVVSEALGLDVSWDAGQRAVKLKHPEKPQLTPLSSTKEANNMAQVTETTFNGMNAIMINGQTYFKAYDYIQKIGGYKLNSPNKITYDKTTKVLTIHVNGKSIEVPFTEENVQIYKGQTHLNIKFYTE